MSSLEQQFASLRLIDNYQSFCGSVIIFLGSSLSKPCEAIEIVLPSLPPLHTCSSDDGHTGFDSACIQSTRQLMPLTSRMPAPATGKTKMFVAVNSQCPLPAAQFDTVAEQRCSLKRCLASVVHITVGSRHSTSLPKTPQEPPSWLIQHAEHNGAAAGRPQENEEANTPRPLQVCSTVVSGLTCSSAISL